MNQNNTGRNIKTNLRRHSKLIECEKVTATNTLTIVCAFDEGKLGLKSYYTVADIRTDELTVEVLL